MKQLFITICLSIGLMSGSLWASAQEKDSLATAKRQLDHYRKSLGLDAAKAAQLNGIQNQYKKELNRVMADTTLDLSARKEKIRDLMDRKNGQLKKLLNTAQQQKMIPPSERLLAPTPKDY
ncbi:hypothetical protein ACFE6N_23015 [Pedobacter sp. BG31]|uniref:hypothetical protein n=1 Tax=Pedobacter sp. BG31 TaxID=3349697 RepID=UPI0035F2D5D7